jgi:hypothetical protein
MDTHRKSYLTRFLIWRMKHVTQKQFVLVLSVLVGLISGLGAVLIKNLTYLIQDLLEGRLIRDYQNAFYFIFPLIGLGTKSVMVFLQPFTLLPRKKGSLSVSRCLGASLLRLLQLALGAQWV